MIQNDIRENILTTNPISENVKGAQKLDEYIQKLLFDDNKLSTLNLKKKTQKSTQEKLASILGPLTRLWNIMEAKRKALSVNVDETSSGHIEIVTFLNKPFYL